jgi:hypothetical protein
MIGAAGSGKSTAAQYLVEHHGFTRVRLADALKNMLMTMGLTREQVDGSEKEVPCDLLCGKTPRWAMQSLGSEWGRTCIGADVWANATQKTIEWLLAQGGRVVVDDVRFQNEADMVNRLGGGLYRVRRPEVEKPVDENTHASEAEWRNMSVTGEIDNSVGIAFLYHQLAQIARKQP